MTKSNKSRGNGEGTIVKRSDGRWMAAVSVGNRKRKWLYGRTRAEVSRKLTIALKSVHDGVVPPPEKQMLRDFATRWLDSVQLNLKPSTHLRYEVDIRRHILPTLGHLKLTQVTPQLIQQLYASKEREGLSSTSVHHTHVVLQQILGLALKWGLVNRNSATLTDPPRPARVEMQILDAEQVRQLLRASSEDRLAALYVLAVFTGIREGELFALTWDDINLDSGLVHVRRTLRTRRGGFEFGPPKTEKSKRIVGISPTVVVALRKHRAKQMTEAIALGPAWNQSGLVFANTIGGHLRPQNFLRRDFRPLLERANLPRITFHQLRHTAASLALAQGVPVPDVSAMLGHAGPHITLKLYSHIMPGSEHRTAVAMEIAING